MCPAREECCETKVPIAPFDWKATTAQFGVGGKAHRCASYGAYRQGVGERQGAEERKEQKKQRQLRLRYYTQ